MNLLGKLPFVIYCLSCSKRKRTRRLYQRIEKYQYFDRDVDDRLLRVWNAFEVLAFLKSKKLTIVWNRWAELRFSLVFGSYCQKAMQKYQKENGYELFLLISSVPTYAYSPVWPSNTNKNLSTKRTCGPIDLWRNLTRRFKEKLNKGLQSRKYFAMGIRIGHIFATFFWLDRSINIIYLVLIVHLLLPSFIYVRWFVSYRPMAANIF